MRLRGSFVSIKVGRVFSLRHLAAWGDKEMEPGSPSNALLKEEGRDIHYFKGLT
jgi:hypothetical protein